MEKFISSATTKKLDSIETSKLFINEIETAFLEVNIIKLKNIVSSYPFQNQAEIKDFIKQGFEIFNAFDNPHEGIIKISVKPFQSRCIACEFGKTVKAYEVNYQKKDGDLTILFKGFFAINFEIKQDIVVDIGWCNAFLSKKEISNLS